MRPAPAGSPAAAGSHDGPDECKVERLPGVCPAPVVQCREGGAETREAVSMESHDLNAPYETLSKDKNLNGREIMKDVYNAASPLPGEGWKTVEEVVNMGEHQPLGFRYVTGEGQEFSCIKSIFLREAACSVLASPGINIRWGTGSS